MYRACLFGAQINDISNQGKRKRLQTGIKEHLTIISVAFDVKNYYSELFCSTVNTRESQLFSQKHFADNYNVTSLGHAGSPCFLSFCYLRCIVLTCSILGSVYLKSTVNS